VGDPLFQNLLGSFSVPGKMVMGEELSSVTQIIQKYGRMVNNLGSANTFSFSIYAPRLSTISIPAIQFLSRMYVLQRGSVRYCSDLGINSHAARPDITQNFGPDLVTTTPFTSTVNSIEQIYGAARSTQECPNSIISIPFYSPQNFYPVSGINSFAPTLPDFPGATFFSRNVNVFNCFVAAGPDFMFGYLIPPPRDL
jgi:hypothetical protein